MTGSLGPVPALAEAEPVEILEAEIETHWE